MVYIELQRDAALGRAPEHPYYAYNVCFERSKAIVAMKHFFGINRWGVGHCFQLKEVDSEHAKVAFYGGKASSMVSVNDENCVCPTKYVAP